MNSTSRRIREPLGLRETLLVQTPDTKRGGRLRTSHSCECVAPIKHQRMCRSGRRPRNLRMWASPASETQTATSLVESGSRAHLILEHMSHKGRSTNIVKTGARDNFQMRPV